MFTVAGAPLIPYWEWRCPSCRQRYANLDDKVLAGLAQSHYLAKHGPIEGQLSLLDDSE